MTEAFLGTENKGKPNSETKFFKHSKTWNPLIILVIKFVPATQIPQKSKTSD